MPLQAPPLDASHERARWLDVVARASTLAERIEAGYLPDPEDGDEEARRRLQTWCDVATRGNRDLFRWRLAQDGLDEEAVRRVLGRGRYPPGTALPGWALTLAQASSEALRLTFQDAATLLGHQDEHPHPLPFEELCAPFVAVARVRLTDWGLAQRSHLTSSAQADLERSLLRQLSLVSARAFFTEFHAYRAARSPSWVRWLKAAHQQTRELYADFVASLLRDGLVSFFQEYSVLGRLMATVTDLWVESVAELLERLQADCAELEATFAPGVPMGPVVAARPGLSDRHHGGRTVTALTFGSGLKLIYKPRNLSAETAFYGLLAWLNAHGAQPAFYVPVTLGRANHGWVEYVEHRAAQSLEEVHQYYRRAGALLAVVYGLRGTDCHHENLIACGAYPVLVDPEMVMVPQTVDLTSPPAAMGPGELAYRQVHETVLGTLFLPVWESGARGASRDVSGLGGESERNAPRQAPQWQHVNTDGMSYSLDARSDGGQQNFPTLDGRSQSPAHHVDQLVDGFRAMYGLLRRSREQLLADQGPLADLARARVRFTFRSSADYAGLLVGLRDPAVLRDAADAAIYADSLCRELLPSGHWSGYWPILGEEQDALERLDIPHFSVRATDDRLTFPSGRRVDQPFAISGFECCRERLDRLDEEDCERQVYLIRASLFAQGATVVRPASPGPDRVSNTTGPRLTAGDAIAVATVIADGLVDRAIRSADGTATWLSFAYHREIHRFRMQPIGDALFDGRAGTALFLAAMYQATQRECYRALALAALLTLRRDIRAGALDRIVPRLGLGGPLGCGNVIYALVRAGEFLDDPELREDGWALAAMLGPDRTAADGGLDVLYGLGGAILGFLAAYASSRRAGFLDQAVACGRRLVAARTRTPSGHRAWRTVLGQHLTGFSHGAAGIAYALARLYEHAPDRDFREAALEAQAYEGAVFDAAVGNWPDYRDVRDGSPVFSCSWCHGAPGIGLARLGALQAIDSSVTRDEIDVALRATEAVGVQSIDGLCCGNMGRVELLFTAGRVLSRPGLLDVAAQQVAHVISRARERRGYSLMGEGVPTVAGCHPGFFQGEAGVGYELLRLADPQRFPSVLLFS